MYAVALHVVRLVIALQQDTAKSSLPLHVRYARAPPPAGGGTLTGPRASHGRADLMGKRNLRLRRGSLYTAMRGARSIAPTIG